jgi:hypothetical protein
VPRPPGREAALAWLARRGVRSDIVWRREEEGRCEGKGREEGASEKLDIGRGALAQRTRAALRPGRPSPSSLARWRQNDAARA